MEDSVKPGPLTGVRVLDLGHYIAAPIMTRMMADLGAEIIKVEQAPLGDLTRLSPYLKNGYSGSYIQLNGGKKSICLDLKSRAGVEIFLGWAKHAAVIRRTIVPA